MGGGQTCRNEGIKGSRQGVRCTQGPLGLASGPNGGLRTLERTGSPSHGPALPAGIGHDHLHRRMIPTHFWRGNSTRPLITKKGKGGGKRRKAGPTIRFQFSLGPAPLWVARIIRQNDNRDLGASLAGYRQGTGNFVSIRASSAASQRRRRAGNIGIMPCRVGAAGGSQAAKGRRPCTALHACTVSIVWRGKGRGAGPAAAAAVSGAGPESPAARPAWRRALMRGALRGAA